MEIEGLTQIAQIAGNLTTQAVLLAWVFHETRQRAKIQGLLEEDWLRQREKERIDSSEKKTA